MMRNTGRALLPAIVLLASMSVNTGCMLTKPTSYLQDTSEIYIMEAGILKNNLAFAEGTDPGFTYDFDHEEYVTLLERYDLRRIAGEGTSFEQALRLMDEFAPRLRHKSDFGENVEMNALSLLEYGLDTEKRGLNCRNKAQVLNEMCLALGIYARKVWLMPYSPYDDECHCVNEVWDSGREKWVMLDITNDQYWIDEHGVPLSVLEIRAKGAEREFCTPVEPGESRADTGRLKEKHIDDFIYIMKNMFYTQYCEVNTVGESDRMYILLPETAKTDYEFIASEEACTRSPHGVAIAGAR